MVLQTRTLLWPVSNGKEILGKIFRIWLAPAPAQCPSLFITASSDACFPLPLTAFASWLTELTSVGHLYYLLTAAILNPKSVLHFFFYHEALRLLYKLLLHEFLFLAHLR